MLPTILPQSGGVGALVIGPLSFLLFLGVVAWTYSDARQNSSHPALLWAVVVFLAPLLGLALYFILGCNA